MKRHSHDKAHLPSKLCPVCGRPFSWRKKWAKVWEDVRYCSEGCRKRRVARPPHRALSEAPGTK